MRLIFVIISFTLMVACQPKKKSTTPVTPPTVEEKIGIYKYATVYAGSTDFEFEIEGKSTLLRVSNYDTLTRPIMPDNLTILGQEGPPETNPVLIGAKYKLSFGPQAQIKSIELIGDHDPSSMDLPAIPTNYSGLLSVGPSTDSRAYVQLASDLSAILLIYYGKDDSPLYKFGRWTRTEDGQRVNAHFGAENWAFIVKENALILASQQMGSGGLTLMATDNFTICHYVRNWLSELSTTDGQRRVVATDIKDGTNLDRILRTEHAYMSLYGELETIFGVTEEEIAQGLRANPTVQGICNLILQVTEGGH